MNHSKTGINAPFYKWLDDVRRAMRKEKELQEKLKFYERQLISCKGVSYDRIGSASTSPNEKDLLYWIDKISIVKRDLVECSNLIEDYLLLTSQLSIAEIELISTINSSQQLSSVDKLTRSNRYQIINMIVINWMKLKSTDKQG